MRRPINVQWSKEVPAPKPAPKHESQILRSVVISGFAVLLLLVKTELKK
jgi:hypothetical protein